MPSIRGAPTTAEHPGARSGRPSARGPTDRAIDRLVARGASDRSRPDHGHLRPPGRRRDRGGGHDGDPCRSRRRRDVPRHERWHPDAPALPPVGRWAPAADPRGVPRVQAQRGPASGRHHRLRERRVPRLGRELLGRFRRAGSDPRQDHRPPPARRRRDALSGRALHDRLQRVHGGLRESGDRRRERPRPRDGRSRAAFRQGSCCSS